MNVEKNQFTTTKIVFIVASLLLAVISIFYLKYSWEDGIKEREKMAKIIAESSVNGHSGEMLKQLHGVSGDVNTLAYKMVKDRLIKLIDIDPDIRFAYFYTLRNGELYFMADSEPIGSSDESPAGQKYEEAEKDYFLPFEKGETVITNIVHDRWGSWKSILVPVKNEQGVITSVFGIDYPAEIWANLAKDNIHRSGIVVLLLYFILLGFYLLVNSRNKNKQSLDQYNRLVNNLPGTVYRCKADKDWTMLYMGADIDQISGYPSQDFINNSKRTYESVIHPDDTEMVSEKVNQAIDKKTTWDIYYRIYHKDKSIRWVHEKGRPVFDDKGEVLYLDGFILDVNAQKLAEEKVIANLEQQRILAESSVELNKYSGDKKIINSVLKKIGLYAGVDRVYIFEDDLEKCTTSNTYEWCAKGVAPQISNLQNVPYDNKISEFVSSLKNEGVFMSNDTAELPTDLQEILLPQGIKSILIVPLIVDGALAGFVGFDQVNKYRKWEYPIVYFLKIIVGSLSSVIQKERHTEKLQQENDKIQTIIQGIGDAVFVIDKDKKIIVFNKKAEELSGFSFAEAINKPYKEVLNFVFEKDGKVNDRFINDAFATGNEQKMANHTMLIKKDGSKISVADSAAPLKDKNNNIIGCVVVFRDTSREREIDKAKSEFVSVASHQLKTPLSGIKWISEILLGDKLCKPNRKQHEHLLDIHNSNEKMIKLVNDLLDVSHIETGRKFDIIKKETDIVKIVDQILLDNRQLINEKKVRIIKCKGAPKKFLLNVDGEKFSQAYNNLINNAIKYSKTDGQIEIGCEHKEKSIVFMIKDHGIGIPQEQQNKIFSKFFRADNASSQETDGTGLGLYIAKSIIEAHDGKIWFESKEKIGTTFYFELPIK